MSDSCNGNAWVVTKYILSEDLTIEVHAHPNHDPESIALAQDLGYDIHIISCNTAPVDRMTLDHDPLHTWLSYNLFGKQSPALWAVATGKPVDTDLIRAEEAAVLAIQAYINLYYNDNSDNVYNVGNEDV